MNIVLAGMPLSGKSTVAREFLSRGFIVYDSDEEIEKRFGNIPDIFKNFGEEYFRKRESEVIYMLSKLDGAIISLGGGSLTREENVSNLKCGGKIVYLKAGIDALLSRYKFDGSRPLLSGDARGNLEKLFAARRSVFEGAADITVNTEDKMPQEIADEILEKIK